MVRRAGPKAPNAIETVRVSIAFVPPVPQRVFKPGVARIFKLQFAGRAIYPGGIAKGTALHCGRAGTLPSSKKDAPHLNGKKRLPVWAAATNVLPMNIGFMCAQSAT